VQTSASKWFCKVVSGSAVSNRCGLCGKGEKFMSEDAVVRMKMLSPTDTPRVSTILEEMFQYFDGSVRCRRDIRKEIRLRWALLLFGDKGYARLDTAMKPMPMVVPTAKLLNLLKLTSLTTDLEPLALLPVRPSSSQPEAISRLRYTRALKSAMAGEMEKFSIFPAEMLNMGERGLLRHSRALNGTLVWFPIKARGSGGSYTQAPESLKSEPPGRALTEAVELEFGFDSETILSIHDDELPVPRELVEALQISHEELKALFKTAARLLAQTNPDDHMRAYAVQDSSYKWRVGLLPLAPFEEYDAWAPFGEYDASSFGGIEPEMCESEEEALKSAAAADEMNW
jgi:hypothetical protein